jgi:hypothetical protein
MKPGHCSRWFVALAVGLGGSVLSGCQDGTRMYVTNRCLSPIEASGSELRKSTDSDQFSWHSISPGETAYVRTATQATYLYFWVRAPRSNDIPEPHQLDNGGGGRVLNGSNSVTFTVEGGACPSP